MKLADALAFESSNSSNDVIVPAVLSVAAPSWLRLIVTMPSVVFALTCPLSVCVPTLSVSPTPEFNTT